MEKKWQGKAEQLEEDVKKWKKQVDEKESLRRKSEEKAAASSHTSRKGCENSLSFLVKLLQHPANGSSTKKGGGVQQRRVL